MLFPVWSFKKTVMKTFIQIFQDVSFMLLGQCLGVEVLGHKESLYLTS